MEVASKDMVMTSARLPRALHEELRRIAFNRRVSLHSLLIEGAIAITDAYQVRSASSRRLEIWIARILRCKVCAVSLLVTARASLAKRVLNVAGALLG